MTDPLKARVDNVRPRSLKLSTRAAARIQQSDCAKLRTDQADVGSPESRQFW
jgi:hypothetical protein